MDCTYFNKLLTNVQQIAVGSDDSSNSTNSKDVKYKK